MAETQCWKKNMFVIKKVDGEAEKFASPELSKEKL